MIRPNPTQWCLGGCTALAVCIAGFATGWSSDPHSGATQADTGTPVELAVTWTQLEFRAQKFLLSAATVVTVDPREGRQIAAELRSFPEGHGSALRGNGDSMTKLILETDLPFGRGETAAVWIESSTGRALQGEKLVHGRRPYWKLWRYGRQGLVQWRAEPAKNERDLPAANWSQRKVETRELPQAPDEGVVVSDPYALLYLVSAARLDEQGEQLTVVVPSKDKLVEVRFRAEKLVQADARFEQTSSQGTIERSAKLEAWKLVGTGRYLGETEITEDVDTGFMGMQGGLTILVEQGTGVPIQVSGRSRGIGLITVNLSRVHLAR